MKNKKPAMVIAVVPVLISVLPVGYLVYELFPKYCTGGIAIKQTKGGSWCSRPFSR